MLIETKDGKKDCNHQMVFIAKEIVTRTKVRCTHCGAIEIHEEGQTKGDF